MTTTDLAAAGRSAEHVPLRHPRLPRWAPLLGGRRRRWPPPALLALSLGWGLVGWLIVAGAALPGRAAAVVARRSRTAAPPWTGW